MRRRTRRERQADPSKEVATGTLARRRRQSASGASRQRKQPRDPL